MIHFLIILAFEWGFQHTIRDWKQGFGAWWQELPDSVLWLGGISIVGILLYFLVEHLNKKEEAMFVPPVAPPIPEPIIPEPPEPEPEMVEEPEPEPEDEFAQVERILEIEALARLKKNIEETKEAVEQEGKRQNLENREQMVKRREKDIEMRSRFGL